MRRLKIETLILTRGVIESAKTDCEIQQGQDLSVDYDAMIAKAIDIWPVGGSPDRVTEIMREH